LRQHTTGEGIPLLNYGHEVITSRGWFGQSGPPQLERNPLGFVWIIVKAGSITVSTWRKNRYPQRIRRGSVATRHRCIKENKNAGD